MLQSSKYSNYIIEKINGFKSEIQIKSNNNLNDESVYAENFVCELLNICYDYNLYNLNEKKGNFPGIDLGDETNKLGIQVTMQSKSKKINETLEKCYKNKCYEKFPNLKFFMLSDKQKSYSIKKSYDEINFNYKEDILDFNDLCKTLINLDIDKQERIYKYLKKQFPDNKPIENNTNQEELLLLVKEIASAQKENDNGVLLNNLLENSLKIIKKNVNDGYILKANNFISKIFTCGISGVKDDNLIKLYYYKGIINLNINNDEEIEICINKIESIDDKSFLLNKLRIKYILYRSAENTFDGFLKQISKYLTEEIEVKKLEIEYLVIKQKYIEVIERYGKLESNDEKVNYLLAIAYLNSDMFEKAIECINKSIEKNNTIKYRLINEQARVFKVIFNIKRIGYVTKEQMTVLEETYKTLESIKLDIVDISTNFRISYYCTILNILIYSKNKLFEKVYSDVPYDLKDKYEIKSLLALFYAHSGELLKSATIYEELYKRNNYEYDLMAMFEALLNSKQYDTIILRFNELNESQYDEKGIIISSYLCAMSCNGKNIEDYAEKYDKVYRQKPYYNINMINLYNDNVNLKKKYFDYLKDSLKDNSISFTYQAIEIAKQMNWLEDEIEILEKTQFDLNELKEMLAELYMNANNYESLNKAQELLDNQLKKINGNFKLYLLKGQVEYRLKNWKESLKYYKLAFDINKNEFIASDIVNLMLQNDCKEGLEELCTYIRSKTNRSDMLMIVAMAYDFMGKSGTADELSFQALYSEKNNISENLMQQFIGMHMSRILHSVTDKINTFDRIGEDCVCSLCNKANNEVINICINSQRSYESGENKIFNAKHISMNNDLAIELLGLEINDEVELNGVLYIVKDLVDKYVYLFRYITQLFTDLNPKSKFLRTIEISNPDNILEDIRCFCNEFDKGNSIIDLYKFDDKNIGIPLDLLTQSEFNQYINLVDLLLNNKNQILYSGERNHNVDFNSYNTVVLTLSSIVILYELNKLYLLDNIKDKIIIPASLKNEIFNCYKNAVIMKKRGGGRLFFSNDSDKTALFIDNKENNIDKQWKDIYEYVKSLKTEDMGEFQMDKTLNNLLKFCNICQCESILLCKKYNAIVLCDDLFLRRMCTLMNADNTNIVSLIDVINDEESVKLITELANKNYYCSTLPIEIMNIKASYEEKSNLIKNLMNNDIKQKLYAPILKYVSEFIENFKIGVDIKDDKIYFTLHNVKHN